MNEEVKSLTLVRYRAQRCRRERTGLKGKSRAVSYHLNLQSLIFLSGSFTATNTSSCTPFLLWVCDWQKRRQWAFLWGLDLASSHPLQQHVLIMTLQEIQRQSIKKNIFLKIFPLTFGTFRLCLWDVKGGNIGLTCFLDVQPHLCASGLKLIRASLKSCVQ